MKLEKKEIHKIVLAIFWPITFLTTLAVFMFYNRKPICGLFGVLTIIISIVFFSSFIGEGTYLFTSIVLFWLGIGLTYYSSLQENPDDQKS